MKKVIILGANGFLGNYLVNNLKEFDIVPITRNDLDLNDYNQVMHLLIKENPYAIINCAMPGAKSKIDNLESDDIKTIFNIFLNFYNLSSLFTKYINIGSGAEFDRATNIFYQNEYLIPDVSPKDNYGYIKNAISRVCRNTDNFYTLRLFGCFDKSENEERLFAKLLRGESVSIIDKEFDFFSAQDFCTVVTHYLNRKPIYNDINCVYNEKLKLSEVLNRFISQHNLTSTVTITDTSNYNYTGNGSKLDLLKLPLIGLDQSIRNYK